MLPASDVQEATLEELTSRRKPLSKQFEDHPQRLHLAIEIKIIDDQVAECTAQMERKRETRK